MRNKQLVSKNIEVLRNNIKQVKYIVNTSGNFQDLKSAFDVVDETVEKIDNLVNIEPDTFHSTQPSQ